MRIFLELEWMRARGHWVALAAHPESQIAQHAQEAGLTFYPLSTHKALLPLAVAQLTLWLIRHRLEVVNTHSSNDGWIAGIAGRLARRPVLLRSRHIEVDYPNRFWSGVAYNYLPDHVLTTSQRIADRLQTELRLSPARVTCIPTGVDLNRFQADLPSTLRAELGLDPKTALVGMISVLRSWKGHATFLEAAALLLESSVRPVHFVIAGDGPGREDLVKKICREPWRNRVTLLGHRPDVANVLASLDVLVLPSYAHEGIPQIILQAQAMARAVVATTIGGIPEVVKEGETGLLVPPQDPASLASKINAVLSDSALQRHLGQTARQEIEQHHNVDQMGEQLLALYNQLASSKCHS